MRRISSLFSMLLFTLALVGASRASAADFCESRAVGRISSAIAALSADPAMRIAFRNDGGLLDGGVCWWHSRFQRAAWYLADFDPGAPAPTRRSARRLIRKLVSRNEVVVIPGFRDLESFSAEYAREIQHALNGWQLRDSLINQAYLRGLRGQAQFRRGGKLARKLDRIYRRYLAASVKGDVLFLTLQMKGIASHASLLQSMSRESDGGYRLTVVDSNFPSRMVEYVVRPDDLALHPTNIDVADYSSVPSIGFTRDLMRIHGAIDRYCSMLPNFNRR